MTSYLPELLSKDPESFSKVLFESVQRFPNFDINASYKFKEHQGTLLHFAARLGKLECLEILLKMPGIKLDLLDEGHDTAIHLAATHGHADVAKVLFKAKAAINSENESDLFCAVVSGDVLRVKSLIDDGVDVNVGSWFESAQNEYTPLIPAIICGYVEIVKLLVEAKAVLDIKCEKGFASMHYATKGGNVKIIEMILAAGACVNSVNKANETPLHMAAASNRLDLVVLFMSVGADLNAKDNFLVTPYHLAAQRGNTAIVKVLLEGGDDINVKKADVNVKNVYGSNPIHSAANRGHVDIVRLLMDNGANINNRNDNGMTPLHCAVESKHTAIIEILVKSSDFSPDSNDEGVRWSPLHIAAKDGNVEIVKILLSNKKVIVDAFDRERNTPLILASKCGSLAIVESLLAAGAKLHETNTIKPFNRKLQGPLHMAARYGHIEVFKKLKEQKADINAVDNEGNTVLHHAAAGGCADIVKYLLNDNFNWKVQNKGKQTPFAIALDQKVTEIDVSEVVAIFIKCDATVDGDGKFISYSQMLLRDTFKQLVFTASFLNDELLRRNHFFLWFLLLQVDGDNIEALIAKFVKDTPDLATVKDISGRKAVDTATLNNKLVINSKLLWHGKYRVNAGKPEHTSATCFVFKAMDESRVDILGNYIPVALKLMKVKSQFNREVGCRMQKFDNLHVIDVLDKYIPAKVDSNGDVDMPVTVTGELTQEQAESMYCVVMPLAERNMFVALKQERFTAETELTEAKHIFLQLLKSVNHMHEKGVLHGDLKTLNIVRIAGQWKLIDLDASCLIGEDPVGAKSSSAYVPPEAVYADRENKIAFVKSKKTCAEHNMPLLIAAASFDVWSLGCLLYQMCSNGKPLFQASLDDNLSSNEKDMLKDDSLWALAEWSDELKERKLSEVSNAVAKNLLSLMLSKDPVKRPTIARIMSHPFVSGKSGSRQIGEEAAFDVFISYRVASDSHHAELLYNMLSERGVKVWLDKICLPKGEDWEKGFCAGLVNSRAFVCLLSEGAVSHPTITIQNFKHLHVEAKCDNVLLEHRLALELRMTGLVEKIFPIMIGEVNDNGHYQKFTAWPSGPHDYVTSIETALAKHMDNEALGTPLHPNKTVASICEEIMKCNGAFILGEKNTAFTSACDDIIDMLFEDPSLHTSPRDITAATSPTRSIKSSKSVTKLRQSVSLATEVTTELLRELSERTAERDEIILLNKRLEDALAIANNEITLQNAAIERLMGLM